MDWVISFEFINLAYQFPRNETENILGYRETWKKYWYADFY